MIYDLCHKFIQVYTSSHCDYAKLCNEDEIAKIIRRWAQLTL